VREVNLVTPQNSVDMAPPTPQKFKLCWGSIFNVWEHPYIAHILKAKKKCGGRGEGESPSSCRIFASSTLLKRSP